MILRSIVAVVLLSLVAQPARGQTFLGGVLIAPDGEKKIGQYVWVWHSATVGSRSQGEVEADCPIGLVVLAGGYKLKAGSVSSPRPNAAFDGWVINLYGSGYGKPGAITVYAACAPKT